jgi:hypothetical protein
VFFNAIPERRFIEALKAFGNASRTGFNHAFCGFPGDENVEQEPLSSIQFAIKVEKVVICYEKYFRF